MSKSATPVSVGHAELERVALSELERVQGGFAVLLPIAGGPLIAKIVEWVAEEIKRQSAP
jgi:hypothetical protein